MKKEIVFFMNKQDCCGCGACANSCPHHAIEMHPDEYGFRYPVIVSEKCVGCGLCKDVCRFQKGNDAQLPIAAYAVQAKDEKLLEKSASGGVFAMLAKAVLEDGGAVFGCALERDADQLVPRHIMIDSLADLPKLQGSKYVQSDLGDICCKVGNLLKSGRRVLFSGTPCQVDGLKGFLRGRDYPNLLTVDLICHGTPNAAMFADYIRVLEKNLNGTILDFKFRDKSGGWGLGGSVIYRDQNGVVRTNTFPASKSSYYSLFLAGETYRSSCYNCPYACLHRPGDLTIGDFWGIEKQHPESLEENGGAFVKERGISCVLINSEQGSAALEALSQRAIVTVSRTDAVAYQNMQLNHPSVPGKNRDKIMRLYWKSGYSAVDRWYSRYWFVHRCLRKLNRIWAH